MTGDQSRSEDFDQDDDFYVVGDEDQDNPSSGSTAEPQAPAAKPKKAAFSQTGPEEEDMLFTPTQAQIGTGHESGFLEKSRKAWPGSELSEDAIGIPVGSAPQTAGLGDDDDEPGFDGEDERFEVVEAGNSSPRLVAVEPDSALGVPDEEAPTEEEESEAPQTDDATIVSSIEDAAAAVTETGEETDEQEIGAEPTVFLEEGESAESLEQDADSPAETGDWAPIEAPTDPLSAGVAAAVAQETGAEVGDDPTSVEAQEPAFGAAGEEALVGAGAGPSLVAGAGRDRPRRRGSMLLLAATLLLAGGGAFLAYQDGWFKNQEPQPTVVRAEVPRPKNYEAPTPPPKPTPMPVASQPTRVDPEPEPASQPTPIEPVVVVTPDTIPIRELPPVDSKPTPIVVEVTPEPQKDPPMPDPGREAGLLQVGDGLTMHEVGKDATTQPVKAALNGLVPGSQAFAQLQNGNFFVGNVKAIDAEYVTLKLEKGEVTLSVGDLKTIVPLASSEYQELKKVDQGFVRLNNRNRLLGSILKTKGENIVLENKANRIVIPKSEIEELGTVVRNNVRLADEDDAWAEKVVEKQLQDRAAKKDQKDQKAGTPETTKKGDKAEKPKVKGIVGDDSAARPK